MRKKSSDEQLSLDFKPPMDQKKAAELGDKRESLSALGAQLYNLTNVIRAKTQAEDRKHIRAIIDLVKHYD